MPSALEDQHSEACVSQVLPIDLEIIGNSSRLEIDWQRSIAFSIRVFKTPGTLSVYFCSYIHIKLSEYRLQILNLIPFDFTSSYISQEKHTLHVILFSKVTLSMF